MIDCHAHAPWPAGEGRVIVVMSSSPPRQSARTSRTCTHVEVLGARRSSGSAALGAVGVCAGAGECTGLDDQVLLADRAAIEPALEDLADSRRVARLGRERRAGGMRGHAVVGHRPPGMVLRGGLGEPDIARVAGELTTLERAPGWRGPRGAC